MKFSIYRDKAIRKITFSAVIAALYFVVCLIEGPLASGYMVNVRLAEGFCVFAFFAPEVIFGTGIGCFLYDLFFGFGIIDAIIGTTATLLGTTFIYFLGRLVKNDIIRIIFFPSVLIIMNAFFVPMVLILSLPEVSWEMYWAEFGLVASGEAIATYCLGIPLYLASHRWLPTAIGVRQTKDIEEKKIENQGG